MKNDELYMKLDLNKCEHIRTSPFRQQTVKLSDEKRGAEWMIGIQLNSADEYLWLILDDEVKQK